MSKESQTIDIMGKIQDAPYVDLEFYKVKLYHLQEALGFDPYVTKHVVMMWIASFVLIALLVPSARGRSDVPGKFRSFFEVMLKFIRDEIAVSNMGPRGVHFTPFLATLFFFILMCNLIGLVPLGASPTSNISVTAALAVFAFFVIHISGIRAQGFFPYCKSIVPEVPVFIYPLMVVIEVFGHLSRPLTLAIRLFANMLAGKIVVMAVFSFIFMFQSYVVGTGVVIAGSLLFCLKVFVAFVQAYVFTFLTAVFIGGALEAHH